MATFFGDATNNTLTGGAGDDRIFGYDGDDTLDGGDGADIIQGGAGADSITGGAGADRLSGGDGADSIFGLGDDDIDGGAGDDVISIAGGVLSRLVGGTGTDRLVITGATTLDFFGAGNGFEQVTFVGGGASILGNAAGNVLDFSGLVPIFSGATGVVVDGMAGDDRITGTGRDDVLSGGLGADRIHGGAGLDVIAWPDVESCFAPRESDAHKGSLGHVLVIGGSVGLSLSWKSAAQGRSPSNQGP